jgi:hypothetical protein
MVPEAQLAAATQPAALGSIDRWQYVDTQVRGEAGDGVTKVPKGSSLFVRGWTLLPQPPRPARTVVIAAAAQLFTRAEYGDVRSDVAREYADPTVAPCGFTAVWKLSDFAPGVHELAIAALDEAEGSFELARRRVEIVPSRELLAGLSAAPRGGLTVVIDDVATLRDPDAFDGRTLRAAAGETIYVRGWAADTSAGWSPAGVLGIFDGEEYVLGLAGLPRDDVVTALGQPRLRKSGFTLRLETRLLEPGSHTLDLAFIDADGTAYHTHSVAELEIEAI